MKESVYQKFFTDQFIQSVNNYKTLGEKITSKGYVIQSQKDDAIQMLAEHHDFAIQYHNEKLLQLHHSATQDLNEQNGRFLSACKQFREVSEIGLQQARELELAVHPNAAEVASTSTNTQPRDHLGISSEGGMQPDTRLKAIMEQPEIQHEIEEEVSDETVNNAQPHKKRPKWQHRRFWMNFFK